jgi:hypothetical protein
MIDIVGANNVDLQVADTDTTKAQNVLSTQLGQLEYLPDFGVDLSFFLDPNFEYQNESFVAYCIERLAQASINVTQVQEEVEALLTRLTFSVSSRQTTTNLVR